MVRVEIYTTLVCPYCVRAKRLLQHKGVEYVEIDVSRDIEQREVMLRRAEGRRTVPQIFIDGQGIGGFDELAALDRVGRLDAMLAGNGD